MWWYPPHVASLFHIPWTPTPVFLPHQSVLLQLKRELTLKKPGYDSVLYFYSKYPKMRYWKAGSDCCNWDGVTCNMELGDVVSLDLSSSWLQALCGPTAAYPACFISKSSTLLSMTSTQARFPLNLASFPGSPISISLALCFPGISHLISLGWQSILSLDISAGSVKDGLCLREGQLTGTAYPKHRQFKTTSPGRGESFPSPVP